MSGIDEKNVDAALFCRGHGIEDEAGGIGAGFPRDESGAGAVRPNPQQVGFTAIRLTPQREAAVRPYLGAVEPGSRRLVGRRGDKTRLAVVGREGVRR